MMTELKKFAAIVATVGGIAASVVAQEQPRGTLDARPIGAPKEKLAAEDEGRFSFVAPKSFRDGKRIDPVGTLQFPDGQAWPVPAMVVLHGNGGQGFQDESWSEFLRENGIATFKVDYFSPRGIVPEARDGPFYDLRFGPTPVDDAWAAISVLATHPRVDKERIGVIGFSRGGTMTLMSLKYSPENTNGVHPKAFVALYPACVRLFDQATPNVPIRILVGEKDKFATVALCRSRVNEAIRLGKDVQLIVYPDGYHAFDGDKQVTVEDRSIGVTYEARPDANITRQARADVMNVLRTAFGDLVRR